MSPDPVLPGERRPAPKPDSPDYEPWKAAQLRKAELCLASFRASGKAREVGMPAPAPRPPREPETVREQIAAAYEVEERAALQAPEPSAAERMVFERFPRAEIIEP